jgi:tRNA pseudouridine38-40 synthase
MHGTVRRIYLCEAERLTPWWGPTGVPGALIEIRVAANGFLPRMVRNIAGTLVEIGRGARTVEWVDELLASRDRRLGATAAPAEGLTLWRVGYEDDDPLRADWMKRGA